MNEDNLKKKEVYITGLFFSLLISTSIIANQNKLYEFPNFILSVAVATIITYLLCYIFYYYRLHSMYRKIIKFCRQSGANICQQKDSNGSLDDILIDNWGGQLLFQTNPDYSLSLCVNSIYSNKSQMVTIPVMDDQAKGLERMREIVLAQRWVLIAEALKKHQFSSQYFDQKVAHYQLLCTGNENALMKMYGMEYKLNPAFFIHNHTLDITLCCIPPLSLVGLDRATLSFLGNHDVDLNQATLLVYKSGTLRTRHQIQYNELSSEQLLVLVLTADEFESLNVYELN